MVLLIRKESDNLFPRVILATVIIIVIIIILYLLWRYVAIPISEGKFLGIRVVCTAPPPAPTNFGGRVIAGTSIRLGWDKTPVTDSYIVYMGTSANFSIPSADRMVPTTANTATLTSITPGKHYFKIIAINTCGQSEFSTEIQITTTQWPSSFKICKADNPTLCLLMQSDGAYARLSSDCPNKQCQISYPENSFIRAADRNLCLFSNKDSPVALIELPLQSKVCANSTNWIIDTNQNRVRSSDGMCLGANSQQSAIAYNTTCSLISNPNDVRYQWTIV